MAIRGGHTQAIQRAGAELIPGDDSDAVLQTRPMNSLVPEKFDYIEVDYPSSTQEVYTYKRGGSGGTTVATVTVNYTDSSKDSLADVVRT